MLPAGRSKLFITGSAVILYSDITITVINHQGACMKNSIWLITLAAQGQWH